ncbi:hypothetical protein [Rhodococcus sp. RCBS9]|uniref:hypothetical protein n=1 Tax=Rhodococcus sp. RCBS9 TaxID=3031999 RepID=UPI00240272BD|nr:hypothetical protein [Rhodococcus sp. RCBS9]WEX02783.1 hypothetical protein P0M12_24505 [Rhodococcus sp. RCBS9]
MSDTTSKDDELDIDVFMSREWLIEQGVAAIIKLCTQTIISNDLERKVRVEKAVRKMFKEHGIQKQIEALNNLKIDTSARNPYPSWWSEMNDHIDKHIAYLTALKTKREVAN